MISIITLVLITYIVPVVLSMVSISASKANSKSLYDFVMRPANAVAFIGIFVAGISIMFSILSYRANQFKGLNAVTFVGFAIVGILLIIAPVKGVWDTYVSGDDITAYRFWVVKKEYKVSQIEYCQYNQNGLVVYMKNNDKMTINSTCTNIETIEKRMEAEGIQVNMIQDK